MHGLFWDACNCNLWNLSSGAKRTLANVSRIKDWSYDLRDRVFLQNCDKKNVKSATKIESWSLPSLNLLDWAQVGLTSPFLCLLLLELKMEEILEKRLGNEWAMREWGFKYSCVSSSTPHTTCLLFRAHSMSCSSIHGYPLLTQPSSKKIKSKLQQWRV